MKKCKLILLTLMISILLISCEGVRLFSDSEADVLEKIHKRFSEMKSYTSDVKLKVLYGGENAEYNLKQSFKEPDVMMAEFYETNAVYLLKGGMTFLKSGDDETVIPASEGINYIFINDFFRLYYTSLDTAMTVSGDETLSITRLETELIPSSAKRHSAVLFINNKTLSPERLVVYDMGKNPVFEAEYTNFIYNAKMN